MSSWIMAADRQSFDLLAALMAELIKPEMFSPPHFGRLQSGSKRASSQMISGGPS
jgi:hypothetical protein